MHDRGFPMGGPFDGGDTTVAILGTVLRFVIWVLIVLAVVWIVREVLRALNGPRAVRRPPASAALAELELRYARGEVSREDYMIRRTDLSAPHTGAPLPPAL